MAVWTALRCDALIGGYFCRGTFHTTHTGRAAITEAAAYGWTEHDGGLRCPEHRGLTNPPRKAAEIHAENASGMGVNNSAGNGEA